MAEIDSRFIISSVGSEGTTLKPLNNLYFIFSLARQMQRKYGPVIQLQRGNIVARVVSGVKIFFFFESGNFESGWILKKT